jgi:hypothetical protein
VPAMTFAIMGNLLLQKWGIFSATLSYFILQQTHGIHDKVVPFPLAKIQNQAIKSSKLVPFEFSGHGSFYDQRDKFNEELMKFIEH